MGSFFPNLTIALIVLKLMGEIDYSWWTVTSPMWGAFLVLCCYKFAEGIEQR